MNRATKAKAVYASNALFICYNLVGPPLKELLQYLGVLPEDSEMDDVADLLDELRDVIKRQPDLFPSSAVYLSVIKVGKVGRQLVCHQAYAAVMRQWKKTIESLETIAKDILGQPKIAIRIRGFKSKIALRLRRS